MVKVSGRKTVDLYRVWISRGQGLMPGPRFRLLVDAQRHVATQSDNASYAIQAPDGSWETIEARRLARGTSSVVPPSRLK